MFEKPLVFIAASWKNRQRVRQLAEKIRQFDYEVYDFTDPECRDSPEIPPERFPEKFDPKKHTSYWDYLRINPYYMAAMNGNRRALDRCSLLILLLPCGIDATADWAYAVGKGKKTYIIGNPDAGERSPVHLWADMWFPDDNRLISFFSRNVGGEYLLVPG